MEAPLPRLPSGQAAEARVTRIVLQRIVGQSQHGCVHMAGAASGLRRQPLPLLPCCPTSGTPLQGWG